MSELKLQRLDDQPVETNISMCEGIFVKHAIFAEGSYIPQHSHSTEHLSVIATGAVRCWADGVLLGDFKAPSGVVIKAHVKHMFLALSPFTTILCVHRVDDDGEPAIHEEHNITFAGS